MKGRPTCFCLQTASDTLYTRWQFKPSELCEESPEQHTDPQQRWGPEPGWAKGLPASALRERMGFCLPGRGGCLLR